MAKLKPETITLLGQPIRKERISVGTIKPGHLLEFSGDKIQRHSSAGTSARRAFCLEEDYLGKGIEDTWAAGSTTVHGLFMPGQELNCRIAAGAAAIASGDALTSNGDGALRKATGSEIVVGYALESINNSNGANEVFLIMEVS